jgi:hypothetical protein
MANSYKNIVITPNIGSSTLDPTIAFYGGDASTNTDIFLRVYPTSNGTLSVEGSVGQLFSVTNDMSNTIYSVNDISGIPSIEVNANGQIDLAQYNGKVNLTTATIKEVTTVSATGASSTINFDVLTQTVEFRTGNATGNWTLNVRGSSSVTLNSLMKINETLSLAFMVTNGGTAYYQTGFTIDGTSRTVRWQGGTAPSSGNINSIDMYSVTIVKTADNTFTVFESVTRFA